MMDRDPKFISQILPALQAYSRLFRPHIEGLEQLPTKTPFLLVGNHSGGVFAPDMYSLMAAWFLTRGVEQEIYGLGHDILFRSPFASMLRKLGAIPASHEWAEKALEQGGSLLIYPGGANDVFRPFWERNRIDFGGHKGFIRLAMRQNVPIFPVVSYGAHRSVVIISRGRRLARVMGLRALRLDVFPIAVGVPWGIAPAIMPMLPFPTRVRMRVGAPIWCVPSTETEPREQIDQYYSHIVQVMQTMLDDLRTSS